MRRYNTNNFQNTRSIILANRNQPVNSNAQNALEQMKYEVASEFGVQFGPDTTSRQNGSVGGGITKRLVAFAESQMFGRQFH